MASDAPRGFAGLVTVRVITFSPVARSCSAHSFSRVSAGSWHSMSAWSVSLRSTPEPSEPHSQVRVAVFGSPPSSVVLHSSRPVSKVPS